MFVLEQVIVDRRNIDTLEHQSIPHHFARYKLLLKFWVLNEILELVLAELWHARKVEEGVFLLKFGGVGMRLLIVLA